MNISTYKEGQRYIIPTSDWGFKHLFATERNKGLLIGLLNKLIDDINIVDLEYLDREIPFILPQEHKTLRFDVFCKCDDGSNVIVEMQYCARRNFIDRALVYTAAAVLQGYKVNHETKKYDVSRTYLVAITGNTIFPEVNHAPVRLTLCDADAERTCILNNKVLQIFIELPKFASELKALKADNSFLNKFAVALKTMNDSKERPDEMDDDLLVKIYDAADTLRFTNKERHNYRQNIMNSLEIEATMYDFREEGLNEGLKKGREESALSIAAKMKAQGIPLDVIVSCTELDAETVAKL